MEGGLKKGKETDLVETEERGERGKTKGGPEGESAFTQEERRAKTFQAATANVEATTQSKEEGI